MTKKFHQNFRFLDWKLDRSKHQLFLNYEVEQIGTVTETLSFPSFTIKNDISTRNEIDSACRLVHLMSGVSYYKSGLARNIIFENVLPSKTMRHFIAKTWKHGLAELAYVNHVELIGINDFLTATTQIQQKIKPQPKVQSAPKFLVALGGGKDSLVTVEELKQRGNDLNLFMVGNSTLIKDVAKFINLPLIQVQRKIDPKLIKYNSQGAFNGHVPITAINSAISVLSALLYNFDEVVFSNEKSADSENTINKHGDKVNHQYSKSYEFEEDFSTIIANEITHNVRYYSQQRQFSELEILEKFAKYPKYFPVFSSCNRNFHIEGSKNNQTKWCCNCPKCRFVFLGLAPFIKKQQLLNIFNKNMLDDKTQAQGFSELLGINGIKPFECVGEIEESLQAFAMIKNQHEWKNDALIVHFKKTFKQNETNKTKLLKLLQLQNTSVKIAIWGYGVEGKATAKYLEKNQINFTVLCAEEEKDEKYKCYTKEVNAELLNTFDLVIKSPGISPYNLLVQEATCQFTSPTALWFANEKNTTVIAITGTKGKSTTVSLLAHVLKACGATVNLVGNIGQALISSDSNYDYIVLEASSFQIYDGNIKADIAVVTNLYPEHVDWHKGSKNYFRDKLKILDFAKTKIINAENSNLAKLANGKGIIYFNHTNGFCIKGNDLVYNNNTIFTLDDTALIGLHNLQNIAAVLTVCVQLNLTLATCVNAIKSFKPLVHRLQNLGKINGHYAINDSIATTPIATLAAMQTLKLNETTLLVGGYDRGNDWSEFAQSLHDNPAKLMIFSGPSGKIIFNYLQSIKSNKNYFYHEKLAQSILYAKKHTPLEHTILLSPGAPSFDEFKSYIKRGEYFEQQLKKL